MLLEDPYVFEPEIDDMMEDPIIKLVMKRDGVTPQFLMPLLRQAAERIQDVQEVAA